MLPVLSVIILALVLLLILIIQRLSKAGGQDLWLLIPAFGIVLIVLLVVMGFGLYTLFTGASK